MVLRSDDPEFLTASSELAVMKWRVISSTLNSLVTRSVSLTMLSISMMPILVALPIDSAPATDAPQ